MINIKKVINNILEINDFILDKILDDYVIINANDYFENEIINCIDNDDYYKIKYEKYNFMIVKNNEIFLQTIKRFYTFSDFEEYNFCDFDNLIYVEIVSDCVQNNDSIKIERMVFSDFYGKTETKKIRFLIDAFIKYNIISEGACK